VALTPDLVVTNNLRTMEEPMSVLRPFFIKGVVVAAVASTAVLAPMVPAFAGSGSADVQHNVTYSEYYPDDICGPRAVLATYTAKVIQQKFLERPDGSWNYHEVDVVTYTADYDDPSLPDVTGKLTEVNNYNLTPGDNYIVSGTFHEFFGDVKIWERYHLTVVKGEPVVERYFVDWVGCP
jgi:hypothetical protein